MKVAIMQPYFMPYLGYYHLIDSVDLFIIYDDIQYTKKGWINRNRLLFGESIEYITVPLRADSSNLPINERSISDEWGRSNLRYLRKIQQYYKNRINFHEGYGLYRNISEGYEKNLFKFIFNGLIETLRYLNIKTNIIKSSDLGVYENYKGPRKVIEICKKVGAKRYVNPIGGLNLYDESDFFLENIELNFIESTFKPYGQQRHNFLPGLSIIDLIMSLSSQDEMTQQLKSYRFIQKNGS